MEDLDDIDDPADIVARINRNLGKNNPSYHPQSSWNHHIDMRPSPSNSRHPDIVNSSPALNNVKQWASPVIGSNQSELYQSVGSNMANKTRHRIDVTEVKQYPTDPRNSTLTDCDVFPKALPVSLLKFTDILSHNILLHPFVALKRACQVNRKCSPWICIQPVSLLPFLYHIQKKQGFSALYKGLSSELLVNGFLLGTETGIARYTNWPTDIGPKAPIQDILYILGTKCLSIAICTPFLCSSLLETVQSSIVVKDRPAFIDCLREGLHRLFHLGFIRNRMLPIWMLVFPTVIYHLTHSIIKHVTSYVLNNSFKLISTRDTVVNNPASSSRIEVYKTDRHSSLNMTYESTKYLTTDSSLPVTIHKEYNRVSTSLFAGFFSEVLLLPIETVINSLYLQGTRVIIDNCDETTVVVPVITNYDGFFDCYQSIIKFEGNLGLFKGFGAILLKYSIHYLIIRSVYRMLSEIEQDEEQTINLKPTINIEKKQEFPRSYESQFPRNVNINRQSTPIMQTKVEQNKTANINSPRIHENR